MMRKSNIMAYAIEVPGEGNLILTPPTSGTILPGITRKTVIDIACDHGFQRPRGLKAMESTMESNSE
ncbi:hypothetical protein ACSBR2_033413 [Camellia fascicularis]